MRVRGGGAGGRARLPLLLAVLGIVLFGFTITGSGIYLGLHFVLRKTLSQTGSPEMFDLVRVALLITGGIGASVALVVAYRKQRLAEAAHDLSLRSDDREERQVLSGRFDAAVRLLGDQTAPAVRLAGVYALASVADDWESERQTCLDVLCSYLRLVNDHNEARGGEQDDREVRLAVISSIADRLRGIYGRNWTGVRVDLSGVHLERADFTNLRAEGCSFVLTAGRISDHGVVFDNGIFEDCVFNLDELCIESSFSMQKCELIDSQVSMSRLQLSEGVVDFSESRFHGGLYRFYDLKLTGGALDFTKCELSVNRDDRWKNSGGMFRFDEAILSSGKLSFRGARFRHYGGLDDEVSHLPKSLSLYGAHLQGSVIDISEASLRAVDIECGNMNVTSGELLFDRSHFQGSRVSFQASTIVEGRVSFRYAEFYSVERRGGLYPVQVDPTLPRWLKPVADASPLERRNIHHSQLRQPYRPGVAFIDATLKGGRLEFNHVVGFAGVIDFPGTEIVGTGISFAYVDYFGLAVSFHLTKFTKESSGSIEFGPMCRPLLLLGAIGGWDWPANPFVIAQGHWSSKPAVAADYLNWPRTFEISNSD